MDETAQNGCLTEKIYREVGPDLLAFFRRRHDSPQLAEDLLQETFAAVLKDPARFLRADSPRAYLFGIARNLSAETWRRSHPTEELPAEAEAEVEGAEPADPRLELMRETIRRMNVGSRQILQLRLQRELSYEEIAVVLGVPVGTVRSRLHYATQELRRHLKNFKYE
jgi:RNA polymerase sigma-70 factor, ECF subfamily